MLLKDKNAIIYGAAGAAGSAVAQAFAREGARVYLTGRNVEALEMMAKAITSAGGAAEAARVDALDEQAIENHASAVAKRAGAIDISFNAIGIPQPGIQGIPLAQLSAESFTLPIATYTRSHFLTARAAARRMLERRSGVILMHTPEPARLAAPLVGGMGPAWAAMEALSRALSAELGPQGIRTVCLRTTGIPETAAYGNVIGLHARAFGSTREQFQGMIEGMTHRRRATTLAELGNVAAFLASDLASAMTGSVANLTGGLIAD